MSLMLKSLLGSKSIWIVILVLSTIGYAYYKYDNLLDIIEDKDKVIISKDAIIKDLEKTITIEKITNSTNKASIETLKKELSIQNNKVRELEVDNNNINKIIEEHKKEKPSTKVTIKKETVKEDKPKFTKYKGIKYEDL
jgi:sulfur transfer complex TusBCD TusB component (DsrH family)